MSQNNHQNTPKPTLSKEEILKAKKAKEQLIKSKTIVKK